MLKPKDKRELIEKLSADESIFKGNAVDVYYLSRHPELEDFSLYNICIKFEATSKKSTGKDVEEDLALPGSEEDGYHRNEKRSPFFAHPSFPIGYKSVIGGTSLHFLKRKQKLGRFYVPEHDESNAEALEDFYRRMSLLFIPWREESKIREKYGKETYFDTFFEYLKELERRSPLGYEDICRCLQSFKDMRMNSRLAREKSAKLKIALAEGKLEEVDQSVDVVPRVVDAHHHQAMLTCFNEQQLHLYTHVMATIREEQTQLLLYVTGTAGVGKTFVIERLADELELEYGKEGMSAWSPSVLLATPTGLTALAIKGLTLHSLLQFPVTLNSKSEGAYETISDEKRDALRRLFAIVKLLIIDEISMVSAVMLTKINYRLQEIAGNSSPFGGYNLVVFGDLLQLPPVSPFAVYEALPMTTILKTFGGCGVSTNLWKMFSFFELTINMRQRDDKEYADLLGRVRTYQMTEADHTKLRTRVILPKATEETESRDAATYYLNIQKSDSKALALFPKLNEVDAFYLEVLDGIQDHGIGKIHFFPSLVLLCLFLNKFFLLFKMYFHK